MESRKKTRCSFFALHTGYPHYDDRKLVNQKANDNLLYKKTALLLFINRKHTDKTLKQHFFFTSTKSCVVMYIHSCSAELIITHDLLLCCSFLLPRLVLYVFFDTLFSRCNYSNYSPKESKEPCVQSIFPS